MAQAFVSQNVVTPEGVRPAALLVHDGILTALCSPSELPPGTPITDFGHVALLPGLVDTHVHINEPGRTHWEGFRSATRAAAAGGYTTLVDMPLNCLPETTTVAALDAKRAAAHGQALVDWSTWGGVVGDSTVADNQPHLLPLAQAGVPGFKCFLIYPGCDGFTAIDQAQLEAALPTIAASGLPLLVHAELAGPIETATALLRLANWRSYSTYLASRPDAAELQAIHLLIRLCRQYRFRLHIVHLSTALALPALAAARAEGLPLTIETCPHYLLFAAEDIPDGATLFKCAPPIRSRANREALWQALRDGVIDMVVTDHSPCPPEMKRLDPAAPGNARFDQAWGGISSLSVALPATWTEARRRGFTLPDLARWMSLAPATLAGLASRAGTLAPGRKASFTVFDPDAPQTITPAHLHTRHSISPYVGLTLEGTVRATYLRGECIFQDGHFPNTPQGRDLTRSPGAPSLTAPPSRVGSTEAPAEPGAPPSPTVPSSARVGSAQPPGAPSLTASPSRVGSTNAPNTTLHHWNQLPPTEATREALPCCGSQAWAEALTAARPFPTHEALYTTSDRIWLSLPNEAWQQAFDSHPRIGQHQARTATAQSLAWSAQEQATAALPDAAAQAALAEANLRYEARFHRIFIVCATGKSAAEILALLEARLPNDLATELHEAAEQQRQITQLRLRRWLEGSPA